MVFLVEYRDYSSLSHFLFPVCFSFVFLLNLLEKSFIKNIQKVLIISTVAALLLIFVVSTHITKIYFPGFQSNFYNRTHESVVCLRQNEDNYEFFNGFAHFWHTRSINILSDSKYYVHQVNIFVNSKYFFVPLMQNTDHFLTKSPPEYKFNFIDTRYMDENLILKYFGKPETVVECKSHDLFIYKEGHLDDLFNHYSASLAFRKIGLAREYIVPINKLYAHKNNFKLVYGKEKIREQNKNVMLLNLKPGKYNLVIKATENLEEPSKVVKINGILALLQNKGDSFETTFTVGKNLPEEKNIINLNKSVKFEFSKRLINTKGTITITKL